MMLLLAACLGIGVLFLTRTRGAIIGVSIGGILLAALLYGIKSCNIRKILMVILMCVLALECIGGLAMQVFHRSYDYERVLLWKSSYEMWQDHKLYGIGFGNWAREYPNYISPEAQEPNLTIPHNVIASFFDETGAIGGMGFLLFVFGTLIVLGRKIQQDPHNIYY